MSEDFIRWTAIWIVFCQIRKKIKAVPLRALPDTPRSSGRMRWKEESTNLRLKKNPDQKYFFIMEKFDFENKMRLFPKNLKIFQWKNICPY